MITLEKPPLDAALLAHHGIKGMHWGHRKPGESGSASAPRQRTLPSKSTVKKVAIGTGVVAGVAVGAYLLSKRGATPATKALGTKSTKTGFRVATKLIARLGKVSAKVATKTVKVTAKTSVKVGKVVGKGTAKGGRSVAVNSSKKLVANVNKASTKTAENWAKFQTKRALRNAPAVVTTRSGVARRLLTRAGSS